MCHLGWLDGVVKFTRSKLRYIDSGILKGRFSVLKALIANVNNCVGTKRAKLKFSSSDAYWASGRLGVRSSGRPDVWESGQQACILEISQEPFRSSQFRVED